MLKLGSPVDCEKAHKEHTDECTMESYARGISRAFANGSTPAAFGRTKFEIACHDASKFDEVKKCVHALEDECEFADEEHTIRST